MFIYWFLHINGYLSYERQCTTVNTLLKDMKNNGDKLSKYTSGHRALGQASIFGLHTTTFLLMDCALRSMCFNPCQAPKHKHRRARPEDGYSIALCSPKGLRLTVHGKLSCWHSQAPGNAVWGSGDSERSRSGPVSSSAGDTLQMLDHECLHIDSAGVVRAGWGAPNNLLWCT